MKTQRRLVSATSYVAAAVSLAAASASAAETVQKGQQLQSLSAGLAAAQPPTPPPLAPAPLGVFGADMPAAGKLVISVIPQFIGRSTSLEGTRAVSSQEIVATTPWYFDPRQKLRGVPQSALQSVQTLQLAYGVTRELSIVVATGMTEKNLNFLTFKGSSGIIPLGMSYTGTDSISDTTASAIWRIYQDPVNRVQINFGMSFPTGSNHNTFSLLQPNGAYATTRAFYAMQIGTGTFDAMPGIVYAGQLDKWSWGLSYRGRFPLAANPEGYRWGNAHEFNGWGGYSWIPGLTTTFRVAGSFDGQISGFDWNIAGKAQAANPNFYGGQRVELFGGATISGKLVGYENVLLTVEAGAPVYQNLNGPQLSRAWQAGMALRFKI